MPKRTKKPTKKLDVVKANRFDPTALAANQAGTLAGGQKSRSMIRLASITLSSIISVAFGIAWIYLAAIIVPEGAFWNNLMDNLVPLIVVPLMFIFGIMWIVDGIKHLMKDGFSLLRDVLDGRVVMAEGSAHKDYDDRHYASMWHRLLNWVFSSSEHPSVELFKGTHFYVLDGQRFIVSHKGYAALTEGPSYRLYYVPHSRRLVNIELVLDEAKVKDG